MKNSIKHAFLAANSCEGFVSHFSDFFSVKDGYRVYIIKGGPGTGKSTFMKSIANKAIDKGYRIIKSPCSSDPDSLDAVIIEDTNTVILDGTAPHIVEPRYPGACENIINLGEFFNTRKLFENRERIKTLTDRNTVIHGIASGYLSAAGELLEKSVESAKRNIDYKKAENYARSVIKKYLKPKKAEGKITERFLSGITPKGFYDFSPELYKRCDKRIIISDNSFAVSSFILGYIKNAAKERGYNVTVYKNPFLPMILTDSIEIEELKLCIMSENSFIKLDADDRRVHARRFKISASNYNRGRETFSKRVFKELISSAVNILRTAKEVHDELENYYIGAQDFKKLNIYADKKSEEILR